MASYEACSTIVDSDIKMTGRWAGIFSSELQPEDADSNYWHNAVLAHHEQDWYCFTSSFNSNVSSSNSLRLKDQTGLANQFHIIKLLIHSKKSGYNEIKNQSNQSVKGRGLAIRNLWITGVNDTNEQCSYHCGKFLLDLITGQAGIPGHQEGQGVYTWIPRLGLSWTPFIIIANVLGLTEHKMAYQHRHFLPRCEAM